MARPFDHTEPVLRFWGQGNTQVLILPGAGQGTGCWQPVASVLARLGIGVACLEYPGYGDKPWPLPPAVRLCDYLLLAARAAGGLGRPLLVGHDMGGWLAVRLLGLADMPALLLAPWPASGGLLARAPSLGWKLLQGQPLAPGLVVEPLALRWQAALGITSGPLASKGEAPCLVAAPGRNPMVPPAALARLARAIRADTIHMPQCGHHLWQEPEIVLGLIRQLAERM